MQEKVVLRYLQKLAAEQLSFPGITPAKPSSYPEYRRVVEDEDSTDEQVADSSATYLSEVLNHEDAGHRRAEVERILEILDGNEYTQSVLVALNSTRLTRELAEPVCTYLERAFDVIVSNEEKGALNEFIELLGEMDRTMPIPHTYRPREERKDPIEKLMKSVIGTLKSHIHDSWPGGAEFVLQALYGDNGLRDIIGFSTIMDYENFYVDEYLFEGDNLPDLLDSYESLQQDQYPILHVSLREYIQRQIEDASNADLIDWYGQHTVSQLMRLGFIDKVGLEPEDVYDKFKVAVGDEHHFGDRTESLSYLNNLVDQHNGKISWELFQKESGLAPEDRAHFEFFRKIFNNQRSHIVTKEYVESLINQQETKPYQIGYSLYGKDNAQNSTHTDQLVFLLKVPDEIRAELHKDKDLGLFFDRMWDNAQDYAGHPGSFGWVRVSLLGDASRDFSHAWLIDEVQSDLMYSSQSQNVALYREEYQKYQRAVADLKKSGGTASPRQYMPKFTQAFPEIPVSEFPKIDQAMNKFFGNWHKVLLSAIMHTARENGITDLYMPTPEYAYDKSNITQGSNKSMKIYDQLPRIFHFTKVKVELPTKGYKNYSKSHMLWHRKATKGDLRAAVLDLFLRRMK